MDGGNEQGVVIKVCFKAGLSTTETLVLVQKACGMRLWTDQTFLGGILDFETEGSWKMMTRWPPKAYSNWRKHCYCCWFGQKWPSNRI